MKLRPLYYWPLFAVTTWAAPSLSLVDRASAASYFCSPSPFKLGTYRPDDADGELDILVSFDRAPFWFDDQSGDYQSFADGVVGPTEPAKVPAPLDAERDRRALSSADKASALPDAERERASLGLMVTGMVMFGQCVPSQMGVVPATSGSTR